MIVSCSVCGDGGGMELPLKDQQMLLTAKPALQLDPCQDLLKMLLLSSEMAKILLLLSSSSRKER